MASILVKTNLSEVVGKVAGKIKQATSAEYLLRPICFDVIELMTKRIHIEARAADGGKIGTYSKGYLKLREEKYNRGKDKQVIVSLTRQLENDWSVIATQKGYGVGFLNEFNLKKARWVEKIKDRVIFSLSDNEKAYVVDYANELVKVAIA
jgi:hypothetical protein